MRYNQSYKIIGTILFLLLLLPLYNKAQSDSFRIYSKFDFLPGEKVVFFDDFSGVDIGDFPAKWNTNGSGEVVNIAAYPGKWLQLKKDGYYIPEITNNFPDNFTAEFDFIPVAKEGDATNSFDLNFYIVSGSLKDPNEGGAIPGKAGNRIKFENTSASWGSYADGSWKLDGNSDFTFEINKKYHISAWVQKQRLRLYINETKVFDIPRGIPEGFSYNIVRFEPGGDCQPIISNFRIAAGQPDLRNKLLTDGKLISYGIYFDVNSDKVKPESYATLKEIATVLKDNPALKIRIVGHTDSDGNDDANLQLSKRRALSVKNELVNSFASDAARIETDGKGETQPIATNDNSLNKAKNRRVEFIKI